MLQKRKAKEYISTIGSKVYLQNIEKFPNTDINILYYEYNHKRYNQQKKNFISFSLGKRILRSETAAISSLVLFNNLIY